MGWPHWRITALIVPKLSSCRFGSRGTPLPVCPRPTLALPIGFPVMSFGHICSSSLLLSRRELVLATLHYPGLRYHVLAVSTVVALGVDFNDSCRATRVRLESLHGCQLDPRPLSFLSVRYRTR